MMNDSEWNEENEKYPESFESYRPNRFSIIKEFSCENSNCNEDSTHQELNLTQNDFHVHPNVEAPFIRINNSDSRDRRRSTIRCSRQTQRLKLQDNAFQRGVQQLRDSRRKTAEMLRTRHKNCGLLNSSDKFKVLEAAEKPKRKVHFAVETDPEVLVSYHKSRKNAMISFSHTQLKSATEVEQTATSDSSMKSLFSLVSKHKILSENTNSSNIYNEKESNQFNDSKSSKQEARKEKFHENQFSSICDMQQHTQQEKFNEATEHHQMQLTQASQDGSLTGVSVAATKLKLRKRIINIGDPSFKVSYTPSILNQSWSTGKYITSETVAGDKEADDLLSNGSNRILDNSCGKKDMDQPSTSSWPSLPSGSSVTPSPSYDTLERVLADTTLSRKFCGFLKKQKCKESLDFYLATLEYKRTNEKNRKAMAKKIFETYLDESIESGINITANNLKAIEAQLEDPTINIFDCAAHEVATMLSHDKAIQFSARLRAGEDFVLEGVDSKSNSAMNASTEEEKASISMTSREPIGPSYTLVTEAETENVMLTDPMQSVGQAAEAAAQRFLQKVTNLQGCSTNPKDYEFVDEEGNTPDPARQALDELAGRTLRLVEISRYVAQVFRQHGEIRTHIVRARKCLNLSTALRPLEDRYNLLGRAAVFVAGRRLYGRFPISELDGRAVAVCEPELDSHIEKLVASGEAARHKAFNMLNKKLPYVQHREIGIYEIPLSPRSRAKHIRLQTPRKSLLRRFGRHNNK